LTASIAASAIASPGNVSISVSSKNGTTDSLSFSVIGGGVQQLSVFPTELNFSGVADGPQPAPANISLWADGSPVKFRVTASAGPWLAIGSPSGQTNQGIFVTPNITGLGAGGYRGELVVQTETAPIQTRRVPVTLTLKPSTEPQLEIAPLNQTIEMNRGAQPAQYHLIVTSPAGGKLSFTSQTVVTSWLKLQKTFGTAAPGAPSSISYTLDPSGLEPGIYNSEIVVSDNDSPQRLTAQVTLIVSAGRQSISVSQTAMEFSAKAQQLSSRKSFSVRNNGSNPVSLSIESDVRSEGASWLAATPESSQTTLPAGGVARVTVQVTPQNLAPGRYYGVIRIRAGSSGDSVRNIPVMLNVQEESAGLDRLTPAGVTIVGATGTAKIELSNPTASSVTFSSVPGVAWLSLKPASGFLAPFETKEVEVTANLSKVPPGVRSDIIRIPFSDGIINTLNVLSVGGADASPNSAAAACVPTSLAVQLASLEPGFIIKSGGIATVRAKVVDSCGNPRIAGSVIAHISSEPNPIALSYEEQGVWTASWSPINAQANVRVTIAAASSQESSIITGQVSLAGTVNAPSSAFVPIPHLAANAASFENGGTISPGSWVSIFGDQLADSQVVAGGQPYPTELAGTSVTLGGTRLPLLFVDPNQLNVFIPFQVTPNTLQQLIVARGSTLSIPANLKIAAAIPGIYSLNQGGSGQGAIVHGAGALAAPTPIGRPAPRGAILEIYATGLGLVSDPPSDGQIASTTTLSPTVNPVTVTIGGINASPRFAGLTPGFVGLYQINVQIPDIVGGGDAVPLWISVGGRRSNIVTIAIE